MPSIERPKLHRTLTRALRFIDFMVIVGLGTLWWCVLGDTKPGQLLLSHVEVDADGSFRVAAPVEFPAVPITQAYVVAVPLPREGCGTDEEWAELAKSRWSVALEVCDSFGCRSIREAPVSLAVSGACRQASHSPAAWVGDTGYLVGFGSQTISGRIVVEPPTPKRIIVAVSRGRHFQGKGMVARFWTSVELALLGVVWFIGRLVARWRRNGTRA